VPSHGPLAGQQVYHCSHALLIGINRYPNLPAQRQLSFARNDVTAMRDVLALQYGFPDSNIKVLVDGDATKDRIVRALAEMADKRRVHPEDRLLIYFSGHGQTVKMPAGGQMGFLIPSDANVDLEDLDNAGPYIGSCLGMDTLRTYLETTPAKHSLVIADTCYSGLLTQVKGAGLSGESVAAFAAKRACQILTAGSAGQQSQEFTSLGHGAFTYKLLEELRSRAILPGIVFHAGALASELQNSVSNLTKGKQTPQFGSLSATEGQFLFITAKISASTPAAQTSPLKSQGPSQAQQKPSISPGSQRPESPDSQALVRAGIPAQLIKDLKLTNDQMTKITGFIEEAGPVVGKRQLELLQTRIAATLTSEQKRMLTKNMADNGLQFAGAGEQPARPSAALSKASAPTLVYAYGSSGVLKKQLDLTIWHEADRRDALRMVRNFRTMVAGTNSTRGTGLVDVSEEEAYITDSQGQRRTSPAPSKLVLRDQRGALITLTRAWTIPNTPPDVAWMIEALLAPVLSGAPTAPGEKWTAYFGSGWVPPTIRDREKWKAEYGSAQPGHVPPTVKDSAIRIVGTYLGSEQVNGVLAWKVEQDAMVFLGYGGDFRFKATFWISPESGLVLKAAGAATGELSGKPTNWEFNLGDPSR